MYGSPAKVKVKHSNSRLPAAAALAGLLALCSSASAEAAETRHAMIPVAPITTPEAAVLPGFSALIERVAPAVVAIHVKANPMAMAGREEDAEDESSERGAPSGAAPSQRFGPQGFPPLSGPRPPRDREKDAAGPGEPVQGQGSGFFVSSDGYIVTNNHVVDGALKVEVVRDNGDILEAKVIGTDPGSDLALLKTEGGPFPAVPLGHAETKVGDWVVALGNPFGLEGTATAGIVSARGRDIGMSAYDNFIQIDAAVNRGNSGGPAFNQAGEVIGVNTAIYSSPEGGSVGIAFAIPAATVEDVITQLKNKGHVTRGWLGVEVQHVTPDLADGLGLKKARGALVSVPSPGGPADQAGIRRGDVILKINDSEVKDGRDLARKIAELPPSSRVKLTVFREDKARIVEVRITELSGGEDADASGRGLPQAEIAVLGLKVEPAMQGPGSPGGLAIVSVKPDGRAADAGLVRGDILLTANGTDLLSPEALERALRKARAAGKKHALALVQRGATQVYVALPAGNS